MINKQIWIKIKDENELEKFIVLMEQNKFKIDFCDEPLVWPIAIDNELKVAFSVDKPSYCGAYINAGRKIYSFDEFLKGDCDD